MRIDDIPFGTTDWDGVERFALTEIGVHASGVSPNTTSNFAASSPMRESGIGVKETAK